MRNLLMIKLLSVFALLALSNNVLAATAPCGETDLPCLRRALLQKAEELASYARESGLLRQQVDVLSKANELLKLDNEAVRAAIQPALDAAKLSQRYWFESPSFLIPVGVVLGVVLTVLAVYGVSQLQSTFPR